MDGTPLIFGLQEHLSHSFQRTKVYVHNHQLYTIQATALQPLEEADPTGLVFFHPLSGAKNFMISDLIHCNYHQKWLHFHGFNHAYKANRHNLGAVQLLVPVDGNGKFDVLQQQEVAEVYLTTEQVKTEIYTLRQLLSNANVVAESDEYPISYFPFSMLFDTGKGFAKCTKNMGTYIQANTHSTRLPVKSH